MTDALLLDGEPLPAIDPELLRATGYGHFSSLQVRAGRVDGLDLHLERLDRSTREVFDAPLPAGLVRDNLRAALESAGTGDLTLRVQVFATTEPHLLIRISAPIDPSTEPVRLLAFQHQRSVPHVKHTGTFDLIYYGRQARLQGYDDAVFHTAGGEISEASIWNICFARGSEIVFPAAPVLSGIRQQLLQRGLHGHTTESVVLARLSTYDAAYLTNSIDPALPVASITVGDETTTYEPHGESAEVIARAYATWPAQAI
jgi:branched-chain amino acid aminotransferase